MGEPIVRVGLGVMIKKKDKYLLGLRKGKHSPDVWCFPGGHLEFGESFEECSRRETKEETGLKLGKVRFVTTTNDFFKENNKHYVTIITEGEYLYGEPEILEPEKCDEWKWFSKNEFPDNLMVPLKNLLKEGII